ncbi:hypothetical protein PINS_up013209 [Pythium insidiosum]|nr:hypothetical protein PINS_up013209 [Pythium insidiosum]
MAELVAIEDDAALSAWLAQSSGEKRAIVLPERLVTAELLDKAKDRLSGVFMFPEKDRNVSFAALSPQGKGSIDASLNPFASENVQWNPTGRGLTPLSYSFPILQLQDAQLGETYMARAKMNAKSNSGATYRAFMKHYYGPEKMDSHKCLSFRNIKDVRSPRCDPIGGQSAWGVRGDRSSNETIVVMAGMDAYAFSQVLVPGANEAASGVVAMLAAVKALQVIPDSSFTKQIVFAAFQAEKFGFVGSRRFLSDVTKAAKDPKSFCRVPVTGSATSPLATDFCASPLYPSIEFAKLDISTIAYAIAVDQVGLVDKESGASFHVHLNPNAAASDASATLLAAMTKAPSAKSKVSKGSVTKAMPPTPLLSFVNDKEYGKKDMVSAVLAGYDKAYVGEGIFGSRHDVAGNLDIDAVVQASQVLAETVYQLGTKNGSTTDISKIQVDKDLVGKLLQCISHNWRCETMKNYSEPWLRTAIKYLGLTDNSFPEFKKPITLYSGTMGFDRQPFVKEKSKKTTRYLTELNSAWSDDKHRVNIFPNAYEVFIRSFLAAELADKDATTTKTCSKTQDCERGMECVHPGVCAARRAHFHDAYSPGLNRTDVQIYDIVDDSTPIWTEPTWDADVGSYVFPDPGDLIGWMALVIGVGTTAAGVVASRWMLSSVHKMKLM